MKKVKQLYTCAPEIYFVLFCVWWAMGGFFATPTIINYPALVFIIALTTAMFTKNKILGYSISGLLFLLSFYLIFAIISDLLKVDEFDYNAKKFATIGSLLIFSNLTMSLLMFIKYLRSDKNQNPATTEL